MPWPTSAWRPPTSGRTRTARCRSRPSGTASSFFGRQAEICGEYLRKGSSVYVEGRLQTRKWTDKDGNERTTTEIRGDRMQMLGGRGGGAGGTREMREPVGHPRRRPNRHPRRRNRWPPPAAQRCQEIDRLRRPGRRYSVLVIEHDSRDARPCAIRSAYEIACSCLQVTLAAAGLARETAEAGAPVRRRTVARPCSATFASSRRRLQV